MVSRCRYTANSILDVVARSGQRTLASAEPGLANGNELTCYWCLTVLITDVPSQTSVIRLAALSRILLVVQGTWNGSHRCTSSSCTGGKWTRERVCCGSRPLALSRRCCVHASAPEMHVRWRNAIRNHLATSGCLGNGCEDHGPGQVRARPERTNRKSCCSALRSISIQD